MLFVPLTVEVGEFFPHFSAMYIDIN
jgi:hypothetical protein